MRERESPKSKRGLGGGGERESSDGARKMHRGQGSRHATKRETLVGGQRQRQGEEGAPPCVHRLAAAAAAGTDSLSLWHHTLPPQRRQPGEPATQFRPPLQLPCFVPMTVPDPCPPAPPPRPICAPAPSSCRACAASSLLPVTRGRTNGAGSLPSTPTTTTNLWLPALILGASLLARLAVHFEPCPFHGCCLPLSPPLPPHRSD